MKCTIAALAVLLAIGLMSGCKPSERSVKRVVLEYLDAASRFDSDTTTRFMGGPNHTWAGKPMDVVLECKAYAASGWTLAVDKTKFKKISVRNYDSKNYTINVTVDLTYVAGNTFLTKKDRDFLMSYNSNGIWQIESIIPQADTLGVGMRPL